MVRRRENEMLEGPAALKPRSADPAGRARNFSADIERLESLSSRFCFLPARGLI